MRTHGHCLQLEPLLRTPDRHSIWRRHGARMGMYRRLSMPSITIISHKKACQLSRAIEIFQTGQLVHIVRKTKSSPRQPRLSLYCSEVYVDKFDDHVTDKKRKIINNKRVRYRLCRSTGSSQERMDRSLRSKDSENSTSGRRRAATSHAKNSLPRDNAIATGRGSRADTSHRPASAQPKEGTFAPRQGATIPQPLHPGVYLAATHLPIVSASTLKIMMCVRTPSSRNFHHGARTLWIIPRKKVA